MRGCETNTTFCNARGASAGLALSPRKLANQAKWRRKRAAFCAKTLSFFSASRARSIDFGHFDPMFRLNAALDRNAIPWFAARQRKTQPPAS
jgi:hypothetical protein